MHKLLLILVLLCTTFSLRAQNSKADNIVIITLDGMRWQEVFGGVDSSLMNNEKFTKDKDGIKAMFWSDTAEVRREKLFPFLWTVVGSQGQLYGNRNIGNYANVMNRYQFSYPGYNEIMTGYPDTAVNSNDKVLNKNENVLEFFNRQKDYKGKVAAFTTWDVFPYILNKERSGIYINSDVDTLRFNTPEFHLINDLQFLASRPIGVRLDVLTYIAARAYVKQFKPKVLYIAFDETDDYAHEGTYNQYLLSAHAEDGMIADLWNLLQSMPEYKNRTTLIVTCDHGRGDRNKEDWTSHGDKIAESGQTWMAFMGTGIRPEGEIRRSGQVYQAQLAQTIAKLMGFTFIANHPVERSVDAVTGK